MSDLCVRCGRSHGCGPQPWGRVPAWVWLCDECLADRALTKLSTSERILLAIRRMPLTDGPGPISRMAGLAESTVRRHLPALPGARPVGHYGWWTLSGEGYAHTDRLIGVPELLAAA